MNNKLTHVDESGQAAMVDVGAKADTERIAIARGSVKMQPATLDLIVAGNMKRGMCSRLHKSLVLWLLNALAN